MLKGYRRSFVTLNMILVGVALYVLLAVAVKAVEKEDIPARIRRRIWR